MTYKLEVAGASTCGSIALTGTNTDGINVAGVIATCDLLLMTLLFWRATASDAATFITSAASVTQSFTPLPPSQAEAVAAQLGVTWWPGQVPTGSRGHATMGDNWQIQTLHYLPGNVFFQSPDLEML